ncbi:MAG: hypothetical protein HC774_06710, partial [Sphingomonadales bacterium]|nr:hypothetical protein [Sphingomonadales bacterium]
LHFNGAETVGLRALHAQAIEPVDAHGEIRASHRECGGLRHDGEVIGRITDVINAHIQVAVLDDVLAVTTADATVVISVPIEIGPPRDVEEHTNQE